MKEVRFVDLNYGNSASTLETFEVENTIPDTSQGLSDCKEFTFPPIKLIQKLEDVFYEISSGSKEIPLPVIKH